MTSTTPTPEVPPQLAQHIIIGFDSEWVRIPEEQRNHILSYQFAGKSAAGDWNGIIYTEGPEQKHRIALKDLMGRAIASGRKEGKLPRTWPTEIYATAHFSRADLSSFIDYPELPWGNSVWIRYALSRACCNMPLSDCSIGFPAVD